MGFINILKTTFNVASSQDKAVQRAAGLATNNAKLSTSDAITDQNIWTMDAKASGLDPKKVIGGVKTNDNTKADTYCKTYSNYMGMNGKGSVSAVPSTNNKETKLCVLEEY